MRGLSELHKQWIAQLLEERFHVYAVILFGSAAQGRLRLDSDIDLAILTEHSPSPYALFQTASDLANELHREVDLIDFSKASTVFRVQILQTYELLLDRNPTARDYVFMRTLKEYAYLNDERKAIITKEIDFFHKKGTTHEQ